MRVLILIPGPLGERLSAPEVRGWNLALELAHAHDVTVAAPASRPGVRQGISIIELERAEVLRAARQADAVIGAPVPPYLYASLARRSTTLVADLYNPIEAELAEAGSDLISRMRVSAIRANEALQLRFADIILCAVDAQRRRLEIDLAAAHSGKGRRPVLRVVPFGIDNDPPPVTTRQPIRERFPQIGPDDPVVLWWGNVWKWFDADTALRAFGEVVRHVPNAKLVFTGGKPPRQEASELDKTGAARAMAERLGLLGTSVYFFDEWIEHAVRYEYLQEADVGLTLHRDTPEKEVAARGRYMDYLWARLPCVLGAGDELADRFADQGFARVVNTGDVSQVAHELRRLIEQPAVRSAAREAAEDLIGVFRWSAAVRPLIEALDEVRETARVRRDAAPRLALELGRAYSWRAAWEGAKVLEKRRGAGVSATAS